MLDPKNKIEKFHDEWPPFPDVWDVPDDDWYEPNDYDGDIGSATVKEMRLQNGDY